MNNRSAAGHASVERLGGSRHVVDMDTGQTHGCYIAVNQKSIVECEMLVLCFCSLPAAPA